MYITENCGILDHLVAGDLILADRGFNIHDSASIYCAEVKLPPFTKSKSSSARLKLICLVSYPEYAYMWNVLLELLDKSIQFYSPHCLLTLLCVLRQGQI